MTPWRVKIEGRAHALLDDTADGQVIGTEPARLTIGADEPVLAELDARAIYLRIVGCVLRTQADARVEAHRTVGTKQVPPADVEEAARRKLDAILGQTVRSGALFRVTLDTAAVTDCRRRRFFDRHQHVVLAGTAVRQDADLHAPEQTERTQPSSALELILQADRLPGLELQLAQDHVRLRVCIPDNEDVVDDALRPLLDGKGEVDPRPIVARRQADVDGSRREPAIEVLEDQRVAGLDSARLEIGIAGVEFDERAQLVDRDGRGAVDSDLANRRPRSLDDDDGGAHEPFAWTRRIGFVDRRLDVDRGEATLPVERLYRRDAGSELGFAEELARLEWHERPSLRRVTPRACR